MEYFSWEKTADIAGTFLDASRESLMKIVQVIPDALLALGIIILGWFLGSIASKGIQKLGNKLKLSFFSNKIGFSRLLVRANIKSPPSKVIGEFLKGYIIVIFVIGASNILGFSQIAEFLDDIIAYIPNVLIALIIVLFGTSVADTVSAIIGNTLRLAHSKAAKILSLVAKGIIVTFSVMAALFQMKIAADLVQILFAGLIAMIALAGGLAFGLGGKDVVRELLEDLKKLPHNHKEESKKQKTK